MENLHDFTESEAELSALNAEDNGSENAKSSTLPPFWETNTGYEYPPIADKMPIAEEKNTTNLVGDQNPTPENSDKSLRFEPTEYKNAPLEARKDLVFSKEPAAATRQEIPPQASYLTFEPTEYKETQLEEKKFDFSCFDKPAEDKNQEIPPALMPFFELADVLEKEKQPFNTEKTALSIEKAADKTDGNPYAEYLGKGGTIYVHVFDVEKAYKIETHIHDNNGQEVRPTVKIYKQVEFICNEHFKELGINLKVKIVFAPKKSMPMSLKEFQGRQDYNPMDSYVVVWSNDLFNAWEDNNKTKENDNWQELNVDGLGYSAGLQFYSMVNTFFYSQIGDELHYKDAIGKELNIGGKKLIITADLALAMGLAKVLMHESGHPKFAGDPDSDIGAGGTGGHTPRTIMQTYPVYGLSEKYNKYQLSVLEQMHGMLPINTNDIEALLSKKIWEDEITKWKNMSWKEIGISLKKGASNFLYNQKNETIAKENVKNIMSARQDLPKK